MSTGAAYRERGDDLLDAYAEHCTALGLGKFERADRLTIAAKSLLDHPDLNIWMTRALPVRLADLERSPLAWPLVGFSVLSGRAHAAFDLISAKHAGRSFARPAAAPYPPDPPGTPPAAPPPAWAGAGHRRRPGPRGCGY